MQKLVYLAGPINGQTYRGCTEWRKYVIDELNKEKITGLSPMRAKEFLREHNLMKDGIESNVLSTDARIPTRDMLDIRSSDAVLFNLLDTEEVSIGTMIEYGWASAFNRPIVTIMEKEGSIYEHNMIRRFSRYRVETLDEGINVVKSLFSY